MTRVEFTVTGQTLDELDELASEKLHDLLNSGPYSFTPGDIQMSVVPNEGHTAERPWKATITVNIRKQQSP